MNHQNIEPTVIVIFGITGDLAQRKLLPALFHLFDDELLPDKTIVLGISRRKITRKEILEKPFKTHRFLPEKKKKIAKHFRVLSIDSAKSSDYKKLKRYLDELEAELGTCVNRLFYLSIPPQIYAPIIRFLGENKLNKSCRHGKASVRLLIEKPFGYDYASALELIDEIKLCFSENQVYRIDHYLAKETVQNILAFRFNNPVYDAQWDRSHISLIDISAYEDIGIENRRGFYDQTGALRDIIQSHLIQLLALVAMERSKVLSANYIHREKLKLLKSVKNTAEDKVFSRAIRGQYETYKKEINNEDSYTETYAAIKLFINNKRWQNVPILLHTGKALSEKKTEIKIVFKAGHRKLSNLLIFRIQPNEGIQLNVCAKKPGLDNEIASVEMDFSYSKYFHYRQNDAYERVLLDTVRGDRTLFASSDEVLESWRIITPILDIWQKNGDKLHIYPSGAPESQKLLDWLKDEP